MKKSSFFAAAAAVLISFCTLPASVEAGRLLRLQSGEFDPAELSPRRQIPEWAAKARSTAIVQFNHASSEWPDLIRRQGLKVQGYLPDDAYIVQGSGKRIEALSQNSGVRWCGELSPEYRVAEDVQALDRRGEKQPLDLELVLWEGESPEQVLAMLKQLGAENIARRQGDAQGARILFRLKAPLALRIAELEEVQWIEQAPQLTRRLNTTRPVIQSGTNTMTPLYDRDLFGEGQLIGHIDGDIDINHCVFFDEAVTSNTPGPLHRKILKFNGPFHPLDSDGTEHGTATAAVAAGQVVSPAPTLTKAGVAPLARLVHSYDVAVSGFGDFGPSTLRAFFESHHNDGAFIHTNSWGDDSKTVYTLWCVDIDSFSHDFEDSLVLFAATNTSTLKSPENAKNCLAVGASWQYPNQNLRSSGGIGPTNDERRKPEIYAPGRFIEMADAFTSCNTSAQSGTSFATPAVAGAAALTREYYLDGFYPTGVRNAADSRIPTGSLLKATLLNGTLDMTGISGYPSDAEGWGRLVMDESLYFAGDARRMIVRDTRHADGFTSTGQAVSFNMQVLSSGQRLKITLVWADPAAAHLANPALINNLDLTVTAPDSVTVYRGNFFFNGQSAPGGVSDNVNNVEQVQIEVPATGMYEVTVGASNLPFGPQGYAVVVSGDVSDPGPTRLEHWWMFH